jgi:hypothetical protein
MVQYRSILGHIDFEATEQRVMAEFENTRQRVMAMTREAMRDPDYRFITVSVDSIRPPSPDRIRGLTTHAIIFDDMANFGVVEEPEVFYLLSPRIPNFAFLNATSGSRSALIEIPWLDREAWAKGLPQDKPNPMDGAVSRDVALRRDHQRMHEQRSTEADVIERRVRGRDDPGPRALAWQRGRSVTVLPDGYEAYIHPEDGQVRMYFGVFGTNLFAKMPPPVSAPPLSWRIALAEPSAEEIRAFLRRRVVPWVAEDKKTKRYPKRYERIPFNA